jgi:predicted acyl esterase
VHLRGSVLLVAAIVLAACSGTEESAGTDPPAAPTTAPAPGSAPPTTAATDAAPATTAAPDQPEPLGVIDAPGTVRPGVEQVTITGAEPGTDVRVIAADTDLASLDVGEAPGGTVDDDGSLVVRGLDGDTDVRLVIDAAGVTEPYDVLGRDDHPEAAFFAEQRLPTEGLGYVETRDGTLLSASVWLPGPADAGPYPTVVEYSGYTPSDPESQGFPQVLNGLGYAYVGVNMRGTGCSGGSFRYFEYTQSTDGYDVIEAVAAQPWVLGNRVGMVGVSYPGISQLFVAQTQPPSLAAITPFSVIADSYRSTLYPGGILNTGFAVEWTEQRQQEARAEGQQWAADRIAGGDDTCADNQLLRGQNPDLTSEIRATSFWTDEVAEDISPELFVERIQVPTFVAGAWQDEQTGGHFATMLDRFTGTDHLYATLVNGLHTESIGPAVFPRWVEFLDLYVAERTPSLAAARVIAPQLAVALFGTAEVALPDTDRFAGATHAEALAAFEAEPPIEVLFEAGAAEGFPDRAPMARWVETFDAWPVPGAASTSWSLSGDATLVDLGSSDAAPAGDGPPADGTPVTYVADPDATPATFYEGSSSGVWSVAVEFDWQEGAAGTYATYATAPFERDTVVVGSGSVALWIESSSGDTDLEATITELRPDGQEMYVQSGWLRASRRAEAPTSSDARPVHTHLEAEASPLPDGVPELVRVELFPFAHAFRAGSQLRLTIDAPGGNRAVWEFDTIADGETVTIHGGTLTLPIVPGVDVPPSYPTCGALRGQPCRPAGS